MSILFRNTVISSLDIVVVILSGIVLIPVLISSFGIAEYGIFVFFSMFSFYGALSFFDFGMEGALITKVSNFNTENNGDKLARVIPIAIYYYSIIGLFLGLIFYFSSDFIINKFLSETESINKSQIVIASYWVAANIVLQFMSLPATAILRGLRHYHIVKTISIIINLLHYFIIIFIALYYNRIDYVFIGVIFITLLRLVCNNVALYKNIPKNNKFKFSIDKILLKEILVSSNSLFINRLIGLISNNLDKVLILIFLNISKVAIYEVVSKPSILIRVLVSMVYSAIIPEVARLNTKNEKDKIKGLMVCLIRYAYLIIFPIISMIFVHASELLYLWVGNQFIPYHKLVIILIISATITPFSSIISTMLVGLEMVRESIWIPLLGTTINVIFSLVFVLQYGLTGLILSTLVSQVIMLVCYYYFIKPIFNVHITDIVLPIFYLVLISIVFCMIHYLLPGINQYGVLNWVITVSFIVICQYLIVFIFFLEPYEKNFLLKKLSSKFI